MTHDEHELAVLQAEWQSFGGSQAFARELAERVSKQGKELKIATARRVFSALASIAVCGWWIWRTHGAFPHLMVALVFLLFGSFSLARFLGLNEGLFRAAEPSVDNHVELTRRRLLSEARWETFRRRSVVFVCAIGISWSVWMQSLHTGIHLLPLYNWLGVAACVLVLVKVRVLDRDKLPKLREESARFDALVAERTLR